MNNQTPKWNYFNASAEFDREISLFPKAVLAFIIRYISPLKRGF